MTPEIILPDNYSMSSMCDQDSNMDTSCEETQSHLSTPSAASVRSSPSVFGGRQQQQQQHRPNFSFGGGGGVDAAAAAAADISLKRDREREGRCADCGVQTHEFRIDPTSGQPIKHPLTVENEVHRGRCLLCHPIHRHPHHVGGGGGGSSSGGSSGRYGGMLIRDIGMINSSRSLNTVHTISSCGGNSVRSTLSEPTVSTSIIRPDVIESSSSVVSLPSHASRRSTASQQQQQRAAARAAERRAIEEALATFEAETADLCDIIAAMRRYPNDERIQEKGCEKLWIQSWDDDNSVAIGRVGGITTILDAMRGMANSQHLQQCGCEALQNLALNDYNRDVIAENGGISVIIDAMKKHWDVSGVQQCGCMALANLAVDSVDNKISIAEAGGVHAIMKAAETFTEEETVMRAAYQALRVMGYNPNQPIENQRGGVGGGGSSSGGSGGQSSSRGGGGGSSRQQSQSRQQQQGSSGPQDVITLDQYGFPTNGYG